MTKKNDARNPIAPGIALDELKMSENPRDEEDSEQREEEQGAVHTRTGRRLLRANALAEQ